ncbi:MAG: phosphoenolpyruvate--protein phosphotransferase [Clostridiales bacterium]
MLQGSCVSRGIAIGQAKVIKKALRKASHEEKQNIDGAAEAKKAKAAFSEAAGEIEALIKLAADKKADDVKHIMEAHKAILEDPVLIEMVLSRIQKDALSAAAAIAASFDSFISMLLEIDDPVFQQRVFDLKDLQDRLLAILSGREGRQELTGPLILVADEISPSALISYDNRKVLALVTELDGATSHVAVIANSLGIPTIMGIPNIHNEVNEGDLLIVDAINNKVLIKPDESLQKEYAQKREDYQKYLQDLEKDKNIAACTLCGARQIEIHANIAFQKETASVIDQGGEGVGLLRSEFLFMDREDWPAEEEQFDFYKAVLADLAPLPVTVRTLDVGGDKDIPYINIPKEENPFLGLRAIRISLKYEAQFKIQLRALLRASHFGNLRIMFPMIATLEELLQAKRVFNLAKQELRAEGLAYDPDIKVGIMVETPAAAILSDVLAKYVDFFSIGTNDLMQYTLAADRNNNSVKYLRDYFEPSILRLIDLVVRSAAKSGIPVGMCGEMASDKIAASLLVGLGLDELSMSPRKISELKKAVTQCRFNECVALSQKALQLETAEQVANLLGR